METVEVNIKAINEDFIPYYATEHSAGADLKANIKEGEEMVLSPGASILVPTGVYLALPSGFEAQVRPRSGLALKSGITVLNTPGTIDADYRGEVCIILINHGKENFTIKRGMRIAQLVVAPVCRANFVKKEDLVATARGCGGFGHSGTS